MSRPKYQLYRHFDKNGELLYVGASLNAIRRLSEHRYAAHWFDDVVKVTIEHFSDRQFVLEAERLAILKEFPKYNVLHNSPDVTKPCSGFMAFRMEQDAADTFHTLAGLLDTNAYSILQAYARALIAGEADLLPPRGQTIAYETDSR